MTLDSTGAVYFSDGPTIQKLSADGSKIIYTLQTPGGVQQIAADKDGGLYATSGPSSRTPLTPGAYSSTHNDPLVILKFDSEGNEFFAASFNAPVPPNLTPISYRTDIAVDEDGNVVFTGTAGTGVPVVNDPEPQPNDCDPDNPCMAYVAALDNTGSKLLYSRLLGQGRGHKLALGPNGDVYVAGLAWGYFPRTFDAFHYCSNPVPIGFGPGVLGTPDGFIVRLNSQGRRVLSSFLGTSGTVVTALQFLDGSLYVGGYQSSYAATTDGSVGEGYFAEVIDTTKNLRVPHACLVDALQNVGDGYALNLYVAGGEMVSLFGEGLGPQDPAYAQWNPDGSLSNFLAGVQVLFDGIPAPMLYAQANQINCIVPFAVANRKTTSIVVKYNGAQADPLNFAVANALVHPFTKEYLPGADLIAINEDGTLNSADHAAPRGSIITIFATGLGQSLELVDGQIATHATPTSRVSVSFYPQYGNSNTNPIQATIPYQGSAPGQVAGVYQLNVRIPDNAMTGHTQALFAVNLDGAGYGVNEGIWLK
jgi:uncharacterized protein (TIGR03437 family)